MDSALLKYMHTKQNRSNKKLTKAEFNSTEKRETPQEAQPACGN